MSSHTIDILPQYGARLVVPSARETSGVGTLPWHRAMASTSHRSPSVAPVCRTSAATDNAQPTAKTAVAICSKQWACQGVGSVAPSRDGVGNLQCSLSTVSRHGGGLLGSFPGSETGPVLLVDQDTPQSILAERPKALSHDADVPNFFSPPMRGMKSTSDTASAASSP